MLKDITLGKSLKNKVDILKEKIGEILLNLKCI